MSGIAVRDPYPAYLTIAGNGVMLQKPPDHTAPFVGVRPQSLDEVAPPEFLDDAQNPLFARPQIYADMSLGFGRKIQQDPKDRFYFYSICADLTQEHKWIKGPQITSGTPSPVDATNGVQDFFELGGLLYMLNGRYVNKWNGSAFTQTGGLDTGATHAGLTARRFKSGSGASDKVFIAMGSATPVNDYYYDGTTYTQMATFQSLDYLAVGRQFYRASTVNLVSVCDNNADPTTEGNWSAANQFQVGDKTSPIRRLGISATGVLLIFKTDGMYSLDPAGNDIQYYQFLKFNPDQNGDSAKQVGYFEDDVYVQYNGDLFRVKPDFTLEHIGPELEVTNDSPVRGYVSAFNSGANGLNAYAGLYNPDTGLAYLMKFGSWASGHFSAFSGRVIEEALGSRIDSWHGSISQAFASKITAMWISAIGAPTNHTRMFMGHADGTWDYFILPCTPDPSACSQYLFTTTNGTVNLPLFTATWIGDPKALRKFVVMCPNLSSTNYVQLNYKADSTAGSYTGLGTNFTTAPRQQVNFPNNTSGSLTDLQLVLVSTSATSCPQTVGCILYHAVRPEFLLLYEFSVLAMDGLIDRAGHPMRADAIEIASWIVSAVTAAGSVTTVLPDEVSKQLTYKDYTEHVGVDDRTRQVGKVIDVKAYEFITNTVYGTNDRAHVYSNDAAKAYTNNDLLSL